MAWSAGNRRVKSSTGSRTEAASRCGVTARCASRARESNSSRWRKRRSVRLDVGRLDHPRPFVDFGLLKGGKFGGRYAGRLDALGRQLGLDLRIVDGLDHLAGQ